MMKSKLNIRIFLPKLKKKANLLKFIEILAKKELFSKLNGNFY